MGWTSAVLFPAQSHPVDAESCISVSGHNITAAGSSETLVTTYQTIRCHNPKDRVMLRNKGFLDIAEMRLVAL
jgi:hypothetical protein